MLCVVMLNGGLLYNRSAQVPDPAFKFRTTVTRKGRFHYKGTRRRRDPNKFRALSPPTVQVEFGASPQATVGRRRRKPLGQPRQKLGAQHARCAPIAPTQVTQRIGP